MKKTQRLLRLGSHFLVVFVLLSLTQVAAAGGGGPTRISNPASQDGPVQSYQVSSTGAYAVYSTFETDYTPHLFSVSLRGGSPVSLTSPLLPENQYYATSFKISPDGSRVVYIARQDSPSYYGLYSIPIGGGTAVRLSKSNLSASQFTLSPDGKWVIFATYDASNIDHLYRASVTGGTGSAVDITPPGSSINFLESIQISPDSQWIVFLVKLTPQVGMGIYSMPITDDGSHLHRISRQVAGNWLMEFVITPNSDRVVYRWVDESASNGTRLLAVQIEGPDTAYLDCSGTFSIKGGVTSYFQVSPDSHYVVFGAVKEVENKVELYSYSLVARFPALTTAKKLSVPIPDDKSVEYWSFQISPDSSRVAYFASQSTGHDLFGVPINGPINANIKLNDSLSATGWSHSALFTPDSLYVVYQGMNDTPDYVDLYRVPAAGPASASLRLNLGQVKTGSTAQTYLLGLSPNGYYVYYTMAITATRFDLWESPTNGQTQMTRKLSDVSIDNGRVNNLILVPKTSQVVFGAGEYALPQELFKHSILSSVFIPMVKK